MQPKAKFIAAIAGFFAAAFFAAVSQAADWPQEMYYENAPIPALCLTVLTDSSLADPIELAPCKQRERKLQIVPEDADNHIPPGMVGYSYKEEGASGISYDFYRYVGNIADGIVIYAESGGGGSGNFSAIKVIRRDGDSLQLVKEIAAGDRCNGSLSNVEVKDGKLIYDQSITPMDFFRLAHTSVPPGADYVLEISALSCFGLAHYAGDALESVALIPDAGIDREGWTNKYKYQPCFNRLYRDYITQGKTTLSIDALKIFIQQFNAKCVEPKKAATKP